MPRALAAHVAVRLGRERPAAAVRRDHRRLAEPDGQLRVQHHLHAARQRQVALAVAQALAGQVHGHQRRRARGVDDDAGPAEVEDVRDAVGGDAPRAARVGVAVDQSAVLRIRLQVAVVVGGDADEDARPGSREPVDREARVLQRLPGDLQQQPVLRDRCAAPRAGEMPKKPGSKRSMPSTKPPQRVYMRPGRLRSASKTCARSKRSPGVSRIASTPSASIRQKEPGVSAPPGNRHPIPTIAIGSCIGPSPHRAAFQAAIRGRA